MKSFYAASLNQELEFIPVQAASDTQNVNISLYGDFTGSIYISFIQTDITGSAGIQIRDASRFSSNGANFPTIEPFAITAVGAKLEITSDISVNSIAATQANSQVVAVGRNIDVSSLKLPSPSSNNITNSTITFISGNGRVFDISGQLISTGSSIFVNSNNLVVSGSGKSIPALIVNNPTRIENIAPQYLEINANTTLSSDISVMKLVINNASLSSNVAGTARRVMISGSRQIVAANLTTVKDIWLNGSGNYYAGENASNGGNTFGWIFSAAPKVETLVDAFAGTSINSRWVTGTSGGGSVQQSGGQLRLTGVGSSAYVSVASKEQFLLQGSSVQFGLNRSLGLSGAGVFYLARAISQYGAPNNRYIPNIYLTFGQSSGTFYIEGLTTYSNTLSLTDVNYIRIRESAGRIYLDTSPDGIDYTNRFMPLLSTYGIIATQLTAQPSFEYQASGSGTFSISNFNINLEPTADFTANITSGNNPITVEFTDLSNFTPTSWSWSFGDSTTSTQQNPTKIYNYPGVYTVSLTASNPTYTRTVTKTNYITVAANVYDRSTSGTLLLSGNTKRRLMASREAGGTLLLGGTTRAVLIRDAEILQDKIYLYKVYEPDGTYIETWKDVVSELNFSNEVNTIGSTTTVELARNSDTVGTTTAPLQTESGQNILTEDDFDILVSTTSSNQIGSGSSVDYNNRVDVTAFYGSVEPLYTESMEEILTEDDEALLADLGAPNGKRVFTGFISEINSRYGNSETTLVQLTSYGYDLDQYPITTTTTSNTTTVPFNSFDPSDIARTAVDRFVDTAALEQVSYTDRTDTSIATTGTIVSYTFRNNTYKDVLDKTLELMPSNWYYRIGLGDNTVYFQERRVTPHHVFFLGKHIKALDLKGSILDTVNHILFTGGGDPALYVERKVTPAARTRRGLEVMSDSRVTLATSAGIISDGKIEEQNKLQYRTTIEILTKQYDIESISVGETVGFRNFGNEVDSLTMQIVGLNYTPDVLQLQLETKPPTVNKRIEDIRRQLTVTDNGNTPTTPV